MTSVIRACCGVLLILAGIVVGGRAIQGVSAGACSYVDQIQHSLGGHNVACHTGPSWAGVIGAIVCLVVGLILIFGGRRRLPRRFR